MLGRRTYLEPGQISPCLWYDTRTGPTSTLVFILLLLRYQSHLRGPFCLFANSGEDRSLHTRAHTQIGKRHPEVGTCVSGFLRVFVWTGWPMDCIARRFFLLGILSKESLLALCALDVGFVGTIG